MTGGPYICILGGLGDEYAGWCGVEHEAKADSTEHLKALRAADPATWTGQGTATVAEVEASRAPVTEAETDAE